MFSLIGARLFSSLSIIFGKVFLLVLQTRWLVIQAMLEDQGVYVAWFVPNIF